MNGSVPNTGRFITFEGIDGAGKSSQIDTACACIAAHGPEVVRTREPGGTVLAESLRALLLAPGDAPMDALTETLLAFAARRDHVRRVIGPALARGAWVVCDRFTDSTAAYQGSGRGVPMHVIDALEHDVQQGLQPDRTYCFDLDAATAAARRAQVREPDRFEQEQLAFFERVRAGYRARMAQHPQRAVLLDAREAPAVLAARIAADLAALLERDGHRRVGR